MAREVTKRQTFSSNWLLPTLLAFPAALMVLPLTWSSLVWDLPRSGAASKATEKHN
jgi:hypothetical protein